MIHTRKIRDKNQEHLVQEIKALQADPGYVILDINKDPQQRGVILVRYRPRLGPCRPNQQRALTI